MRALLTDDYRNRVSHAVGVSTLYIPAREIMYAEDLNNYYLLLVLNVYRTYTTYIMHEVFVGGRFSKRSNFDGEMTLLL